MRLVKNSSNEILPSTRAPALGAALQVTAMGELAQIEAALSRSRSRHRGVHEARKSIRRLRALLALGDGVFGAAGQAIDQQLSRVGDSLSSLRDAQVVVDTTRRLERRASQADRRETWHRMRAALSERRAQVLARAISADPQFSRRRGRVHALRQALYALPWDDLERRELAAALERQGRRCEKAHRHAEENRSAHARHRWRRKLRRLRMQMDLIKKLTRAEPAPADAARVFERARRHVPSPKRLAKRADALGRDQDLEVLRRAVRGFPPGELRDDGLKALRRAMR